MTVKTFGIFSLTRDLLRFLKPMQFYIFRYGKLMLSNLDVVNNLISLLYFPYELLPDFEIYNKYGCMTILL